MESQEKLQESYLKVLEKIEVGSNVSGIVVNIIKDYILLDVRYKSEGFIRIEEFKQLPKIGDRINAIVSKIGEEGLLLSVEKLEALNLKDKIDDYIKEKKVLRGKVVAEFHNGYRIQISENIFGFIPFYLSSISKDEKLKKGSFVEFYIIEASKTNGIKLILDRKTFLKDSLNSKRKTQVMSYKENDIVDGIVEAITDYGAIIKIRDLVTGILYKGNISYKRVENIVEFINIGDKLKLKIIKINYETGKMELSLKALEADPWDSISLKYKVDDIVKGKVIKLLPFGAIVELDSDITGFLHISNLSWVKMVKSPQELIKAGQIVEVKILEIDKESHKISLGIKQVSENPWNKINEKYPVSKVIQGTVKNITKTGAFINLEEGVDAYITKFNVSWFEEIDPETYFKIGEVVNVKVLGVNAKKKSISVGIKQLEENPFEDFSKSYKKGDHLDVEVLEKKSKGVQVKVYGKVIGFISKIQLANTKEDSLKMFDKLNIGDKVKAIITNIDFKNKSVILSLREYDNLKTREEISSYLFNKNDEEVYKPFAELLKKGNKH